MFRNKAFDEKIASMSTLWNSTTTLNNIFDSQLLSQTGDQEIKESTIKDNSYLGRIHREFRSFSKKKRENVIKKTKNCQPIKKAKLYYSPSTLSKKVTHSEDKISLQTKITKKKSAGFELANQIRK